MTKSNDGEFFVYLPEKLQRFCEEHYEEQQRQQDCLPFEMVSMNSHREDHDAILSHANQVLSQYDNSGKLMTAATLVLLNTVGFFQKDMVAEIFGDEVAVLMADTITSFDSNSGNAALWEESLHQMARASSEAKRVRLALLLGQVMHSPGATGHLPFWHQEAMALSGGDPQLHKQVMTVIETDWAAS